MPRPKLDGVRRKFALQELSRLKEEMPALTVRADLLVDNLTNAQKRVDSLTDELDEMIPDPVPPTP